MTDKREVGGSSPSPGANLKGEKMSKIIGCLVAWGAEDFIEAAMNQALEYCDEVHVCIAPHSQKMKKYEDSTFLLAKKYFNDEKVSWYTFDNSEFSNHSSSKSEILNSMLSNSKLMKPGNWIWILDVDEFYNEQTYRQIKELIHPFSPYDRIDFQEFYFYINMWNFLEGDHLRLFKIKSEDNIFYPTQRWPYATKPVLLSKCMYHYGMLTNPHAKVDFWKSEYPWQEQNNKVKWLTEIYKNYDLNNEEYWINQNYERFGIKSPWFSDSFKPRIDGKLFKYISGDHPKFINKELLNVKDFRRKFNFLPDDK